MVRCSNVMCLILHRGNAIPTWIRSPKSSYHPYSSIIYYTKFISLSRKGLDICPLPADVRHSCFRGGAGARGGKPPVSVPSDIQQWAESARHLWAVNCGGRARDQWLRPGNMAMAEEARRRSWLDQPQQDGRLLEVLYHRASWYPSALWALGYQLVFTNWLGHRESRPNQRCLTFQYSNRDHDFYSHTQ